MFPYFLMIGLPAALAILAPRDFNLRIALLPVVLVFVAIIGLRYDVGPDWFAYTVHAQRIPEMPLTHLATQGEVGWALMVKLSDMLGLGILGMTLFSALVFCLGLFAIARVCQEPMLAVVAAVPYLSIAVAMSGMRQAIAIGIVFVLIAYWYRLSVISKIAIVLFASTFHFSALAMMVLVVFDGRMRPEQRLAIGFLVFAVLTYFLLSTDYRVERYARDYMPGGVSAEAPGALYHVLLTSAPALAYFAVRKRWRKVYGTIPIIDILAAIGVIALFFVFLFPTATDRLTLYFSGVALIIQANLPRLWKKRSDRYLVRTAIIVLNIVALATFLIAGNKAKSFVPYMSVFSEQAEMGLPRR